MSLIPKKQTYLSNHTAIVANPVSVVANQTTAEDTQRLIMDSRARIDELAQSRDKTLENRMKTLPKLAVRQFDPLQPISAKVADKPSKRPPSPPAVRERSPPREEKKPGESWKVPAAISNWRNKSGHLVTLADRVAASGGGAERQVASVNRKFVDLASELYAAETSARADAERRKTAEQQQVLQEQTLQEKDLEQLEKATRGLAQTETISSQFSQARRELLKETLKEHRSAHHRQTQDKDISDLKGDALFDARIFTRSVGGHASDNLYQRPLFGERSASAVYAADRKRLAEVREELDAAQEGRSMPVQFDTRPDIQGEPDEDLEPPSKRHRQEDSD